MELQYIILAIFLSIAFYTDVKTSLIHNKLIVSALLMGYSKWVGWSYIFNIRINGWVWDIFIIIFI